MHALPRILVVEDDPPIADVVEFVLSQHGFRVCRAADPGVALDLFAREPHDLVILDLLLPGMSGFDLFRHLRRLRDTVPIIMLTSRTDEIDRVSGLEMGADDYVTKPFSARELAARVRAVLRRRESQPGAEGARPGSLTVDAHAGRASWQGRDIPLTHAECRLLGSLARHPARVLTREALLDAIYEAGAPVTDRTVDSYVKRVRRKFEDAGATDPILTVHGIGYRLHPSLGGLDAPLA